MNVITLIGRLTNDPEIRWTQNENAVANFVMAVDRATKEKETDFIPCTAFRHNAEFMERNCYKGQRVAVQGKLQIQRYEKDGENKTYAKVLVYTLEPMEWKNEAEKVSPFD